MNRKSIITLAILCFLALPFAAWAGCGDPSNCFLVRVPNGSDVAVVLQSHGLQHVDDAHTTRPEVFLAEGGPGNSPAATLQNLVADGLVVGAETAALASLSEGDADAVLDAVPLATPTDLNLVGAYDGPAATHFNTSAWNGYLDQTAASLVRLDETHALSYAEAQGTGMVAIIDTGVDPDHELLQGALVNGYDFLQEQYGIPSEWDALDPTERQNAIDDLSYAADQSYGVILEGTGSAIAWGADTETGVEIILDQSYGVILEQSYGVILEGGELPAAFGHGTMVAGLVRLAAPGAQIMPLRAFDGDGNATVWDIVKGIYYATEAGANVINMSFSVDQHSEILANAVNYAKVKGVICVSSTGNEGTANLTYPAALGNVIGVASTDNQDQISAFSNYGLGLATLAAPGEGVITLFPGGLYAAAWGTSFSAGLVSGTVALLHEWRAENGNTFLKTVNFALGEMALTDSAYNPTGTDEWGAGRLDSRAAFANGLVGV